jgi:putative holliday junction resolvase
MKESSIIALDVGESRIGIARANSLIGFPAPLLTLKNDKEFWSKLSEIIKEDLVTEIVVGLPRSLNGNDTEQTKYTQVFISELSRVTDLPIHTQDESLTSKKAEVEIANAKNPKKYDVDSLAATYILEDFLASRRSTK